MSEEKRCEKIKERIKEACLKVFGENLVGIYLHGSLAFGCFLWEKSDIDFLVAVKNEPNLPEKMQFIDALLAMEDDCPPKGLEMSVVLERDCRNFVYPTPYVLHFSNMHKEKCRENLEDYCRSMKGTDKDLAAHFTVVRAVGIVLWGKQIAKVFGSIPAEAYLDSIREDICVNGVQGQNICAEIAENPVYLILNACRVLAFVKEGVILSKEQGGRWGMNHLPGEYTGLIEAALRDYAGEGEFHVDKELPGRFAEYVQGENEG